MTNKNLIDPLMPAQEMRWHMGEMTAQELRTARTAIAWANSAAAALIEQQEALLAELYESLTYIKTRERVLAGMSIADAEIHTTTEMNMIKAIYAALLAAKTQTEDK